MKGSRRNVPSTGKHHAQESATIADVVLLEVPKPNLLLKTPEFYEALSDKYKIPFDGNIIPKIISKRSLKSDRIHPNADGYKKLAEAIAQLLIKNGMK